MRNRRNALLASLAAMALVAGAGAVSAQAPSHDRAAAPGGEATHQATTPAAPNMGERAQHENRKGHLKQQHSAQTHNGNRTTTPYSHNAARMEHNRKGDMTRNEHGKAERSAQTRGFEQQNGAGRHNGLEGLQGNASGMHARLSEQQRTQIRNTVINAPGAPRLANAHFDVAVGSVVPRAGVRLVPVPTTLARIDPSWRGFRYFVWNDELVIVNPHDMRIIAVVPV